MRKKRITKEKNTCKAILEAMEAFQVETGMTVNVLGKRSVKDYYLHDRLKNGGTMTIHNYDRLINFMKQYKRSFKDVTTQISRKDTSPSAGGSEPSGARE